MGNQGIESSEQQIISQGGYKIEKELREGGFGVVYIVLKEQTLVFIYTILISSIHL